MLISPRGAGFVPFVRLERDEVPSFDEHPFCVPAIKHLHQLDFDPRVTFFVGENGTGKSTLIEAIALKLGFSAMGGTRNMSFNTRTIEYDPYAGKIVPEELLRRCLRVARFGKPSDGFFLRAESFHEVVTHIDDLDAIPAAAPKIVDSYGGIPLHQLSHGESFFQLMDKRFGGDGLYIFDEPEAALSPQRQFAMLQIIDRLVHDHSQLIIATHSPLLLAYPFATIYQLSATGIEKVKFEDTEHYRFYRDVLNAPKRYVERLLRRDDDLPSNE